MDWVLWVGVGEHCHLEPAFSSYVGDQIVGFKIFF